MDYIILTHGDTDHAGEISYLNNNFKVKNVIINKDGKNYLEQSIDEKLLIDDYHGKISFIVLPSPKLYDNENDNSNITLLNAYNYKIIFINIFLIKNFEIVSNIILDFLCKIRVKSFTYDLKNSIINIGILS